MNLERFIAPLFSTSLDSDSEADFDVIPSKEITTISTDAGILTLIPAVTLQKTAEAAFERLSFTFPREHLVSLIHLSQDPDASKNDKLIAAYLLRNAQTAADGVLPLCQDTGIANVFAWRGNRVLVTGTGADSEETWLEKGIEHVYKNRNLRFSTNCASSMFTEIDPRNNMPAQIEVAAGGTGSRLNDNKFTFIFTAKGGGSSNKTQFMQETKAALNEAAFTALLEKHITSLGTSACPPYSIAVVVGGLSPEQNLTVLKLATVGAFDRCIPVNEDAVNGETLFRDAYWERKVMEIAASTRFGAQFGGKYLALQATVIRLPRHGASCPISLGVSCSAHRNLRAFIDSDGIHLQKTVSNPATLPGFAAAVETGMSSDSVMINLDDGIEKVRCQLDKLKPGTFALLSGKMLVARDKAHARWKELFDTTGTLPDYTYRYPICYAGPAQTPTGEVIGSFGPTTAGRMDSYAELLMSHGASLITVAKGNRSTVVGNACKKYGGFYLGTPGGTAALIAKEHITAVETLDYPEFGMEAVRLVTVKNLPVCVLIDNKGDDFYRGL